MYFKWFWYWCEELKGICFNFWSISTGVVQSAASLKLPAGCGHIKSLMGDKRKRYWLVRTQRMMCERERCYVMFSFTYKSELAFIYQLRIFPTNCSLNWDWKNNTLNNSASRYTSSLQGLRANDVLCCLVWSMKRLMTFLLWCQRAVKSKIIKPMFPDSDRHKEHYFPLKYFSELICMIAKAAIKSTQMLWNSFLMPN